MRFFIVCQYFYPENVAITDIAKDLVKRGHEVTVLTGRPNYGYGRILKEYRHVKYEVIDGVKVHRVKLFARKKSRISLILNYLSFWVNSQLFVKTHKEQFDVVYGMSMSPLISVEAGAKYAKKNHIPLVIHCLDLWPESAVFAGKVKRNSLVYRILYKWSRRLYASADKVLLSSPSFASYFRDVLKLPDLPLEVVPQPPLVSPYGNNPIQYKKKNVLVYAGNLGNLQLVENFVDACSILKGEFDFSFTIVGSGQRESAIKELIDKKNLSDFVDLIGTIPSNEVPNYFENADGLVVSLKDSKSPVSKTIPNKLISSLYYSKPIVAVIGGDGKKILEDAGGSFFANEGSLSIAEAVAKLFIATPEKRQEMGANNKKYFDEHYSFEIIMDQLEASLIDLKKD